MSENDAAKEGECNCDETYGFNHEAGTVHCRKCGHWWKLKGEESAVVTSGDLGELERLSGKAGSVDRAEYWKRQAEAADAEVARLKAVIAKARGYAISTLTRDNMLDAVLTTLREGST